jgi:hypothetical protein
MSAESDQVLYDHIGQIVHTAILQGIIVGSRETGSQVIREQADEITVKATKEVIQHLKARINQVRKREQSERMNDPF